MKNYHAKALVLFAVFTFSSTYAYERKTHSEMAVQAFQSSKVFTDPRVATDLGIDVGLRVPLAESYFDQKTGLPSVERKADDYDLTFIPLGVVKPTSAAGWMASGAVREDDLNGFTGCIAEGFGCNPQNDPYENMNRLFNHFFDPIDKSGLSGTFFGLAAPTWALGLEDAFSSPVADAQRRNHYTIIDARRAMYTALTGRGAGADGASKAVRNAYWATVFRSLGDVTHVLMDMAQPQHTRIEYHPLSGYEKYINSRAIGRETKFFSGAVTLLEPLTYTGYSPPNLPTYVRYWTDQSQSFDQRGGLADYSNREFLTEGHNLGNSKYDSPPSNVAAYERETVQNTPTSTLTYLKRATWDAQTQVPTRSIRMTSRSRLFAYAGTWKMDRAVWDDQAELLVPRAVGYSAGLLDYFFRGQIDCKKDSAIPGGCRIVNLSSEELEGTFEFFYEAVDGQIYAVPNAKFEPAFLPPGPSTQFGLPAVFQPPTDPPPARADEYILVFNGRMGQERPTDSDTIGAVAAKIVRPDSGALYVLVGQPGGLFVYRSDASGTRPLAAGEIDPFQDWYSWINALAFQLGRWPTVGDPYVTKQVVYGSHPLSYRTTALQVRTRDGGFGGPAGISATYFANDGPAVDYIRDPSLSWIAKSPDASIGTFKFTRTTSLNTISYTRTYADASGPHSVSGNVPITFRPGISFFGTQVSSDGTRVAEVSTRATTSSSSATQCVRTTISSSTATYWDLQISLSANPTASFVQVDQFPFASTGQSLTGADGCSDITLEGSSSGFLDRQLSGLIRDQRQVIARTQATSGKLFQVPPGPCGDAVFNNSSTTYTFADGGSTTTFSNCDAGGASSGGVSPFGSRYTAAESQQVFTDQQGHLTFRGQAFSGSTFVQETSPLGELFFATPDGSLIVHEPLQNRIPKFVKPPNTQAIISAIWM